MWFELKGDARLGQCATEGCGGQPTSRLEVEGVGSNYCSGCRSKIAREPCPYCSDGKRTGLPSNACENCMNTGLKYPETDSYGNTADRIINCCFPDCGCDGARLCMAENGASSGALELNLERRRR